MVKLTDLASIPDSRLGPILVSPSRRFVEGPAGRAQPEPLTMQVFLLLLDAGGRVVTRKELFDQCWGGAMVGDDSLNQAVGKVRRIGTATAPGLFEIETIPRTGYRLAGPILAHLPDKDGIRPTSDVKGGPVSRRVIIGSAAAGSVALAGGLALWAGRRRESPAQASIDRGHDLLRHALPGSREKAVAVLRQSVRADPQSALAWGLLAYALASGLDDEVSIRSPDDAAAAEEAFRQARKLDPREPNGLLAHYIVDGSLNDWVSADQRLRSILKLDPDNVFAISRLASLLQAAGYTGESLTLNERQVALNPLSPNPHYRRGLLLWIKGDVVQADMAVDRAMERWPNHRWVWNARFLIYAFTGRAKAALAMLNDAQSRPETISPEVIETWRLSFAALASPTPSAVARAREANLAAAREAPGLAAYAVMTLSALGEIDPAFEILNGFLLGRGNISTRRSGTQGAFVGTHGWRRTHWLFTPPLAAMRADPRFRTLCQDVGLQRYWAYRRLSPDWLKAGA